jgi:hypothetical protein
MPQELLDYAGCDGIIDNRNKLVFENEEEFMKVIHKVNKERTDYYFNNISKFLQKHSPTQHLQNSPQL